MADYEATAAAILAALEPGTPYAARQARDLVEARIGHYSVDFNHAWTRLQTTGRITRVGWARKGPAVRWQVVDGK